MLAITALMFGSVCWWQWDDLNKLWFFFFFGASLANWSSRVTFAPWLKCRGPSSSPTCGPLLRILPSFPVLFLLQICQQRQNPSKLKKKIYIKLSKFQLKVNILSPYREHFSSCIKVCICHNFPQSNKFFWPTLSINIVINHGFNSKMSPI